MQLHLIPSNDDARLITLLRDAEEDVTRIQQSLKNRENSAYFAFSNDLCVGALIVRWQPDESEILYVAVEESLRGKGYGAAIIGQTIAGTQQRASNSLIVGTANCSLDNIAFYQKCGFRMDTVRKNYFDYLSAPVYEHGILMQDMLVLRYTCTPADANRG